jgi:hypothetical protein
MTTLTTAPSTTASKSHCLGARAGAVALALLAGTSGPLASAGAAGPPATATAPADDTSIRPFTFYASDGALADLRRRIVATQWPEQETVGDATQGVQLAITSGRSMRAHCR